MKKKLLDE
jgi:hypothetical protein